MSVKGNWKWRPWAGVLAVGLLAFGLSLQGAPAGDGSAAPGLEKISVKRSDALNTDLVVRPEVSPLDATDKANPAVASWFGAIRSVSDSVVVTQDAAGRGGRAEGDACGCDSECADLNAGDGCIIGQCIRQGETEEDNIDGECHALIAFADTVCERDGDPCTVGRCGGGDYAGQCMDGTLDEECDADVNCVAGYGRGSVSPCATECYGGDENGQNCDTVDDCDVADGIVTLGCGLKPGVTCTDDGGNANCAYDSDDGTAGVQAIGRCCGGDVNPDGFTGQVVCEDDNGTWVEITDPDDLMHLPVRCPAYSSGLGVDGADDENAVGAIVPPAKQCFQKDDEANFGNYCEIDADCAKRCVGGDNPGAICTRAAACPNGTCEGDVCVDVLDGIGRCDGYYMLGDDYQFNHTSYVLLQEIRWRGGLGVQREVVSFDFYTHEDLDPTGPTRLFTWSVRFGRGGTIGTYWLEPNCDPNCDPAQECPGQSCECQSTNAAGGGGCYLDPPLHIPHKGYIVAHAARFLTAGVPNDLTGVWAPAVGAADIGTNDPNVMWVNDGPIGVGDPGPLAEGARVLAFELIGDPLDEDPIGACCDDDTCTDTLQAKCRFCAGDGPNIGQICDRGQGNWTNVDRDCDGADEDCLTINYLGPRTRADYNFPETSDAATCADNPCDFGACCQPDGSCDDLHDLTWCEDQEGDFLGFGTNCMPNCCPQPYTGPGEELGGDCCGDIYWCTGTVAGEDVTEGTRCDPDGVDPYNCFSTCRCSVANSACDIANGECHDLGDPGSSTNAPCSVEVDNCLDPDETCEYVEPCGTVCSVTAEDCELGGDPCANVCSEAENECDTAADCHLGNCTNLPIPCNNENPVACNGHPEFCEVYETCDAQTCEEQTCECGSCELVCEGPVVVQAVVPQYPDCLATDSCTNTYDFTSDSRVATDEADDCAGGTDSGWYNKIHLPECAKLTFTFCCNFPVIGLVAQNVTEGCPCAGRTELHQPNDNRSGYGDGCGNDHCCSDGNYSVEWTLGEGTYWYTPLAGMHCEGTNADCSNDSECEAGTLCFDEKRIYQGHWIVEPCTPGACCFADACGPLDACDVDSDNFMDPCEIDDDCPNGLCQHFPLGSGFTITELECEELHGDFLSNLEPNPIADCAFTPCDIGSCCLQGGECRNDSGANTRALCESLPEGEYHGGVLCSHRPCAVCAWDDLAHCQTNTGQFVYDADRFLGIMQADDFRATGTSINEICLDLGYILRPAGECSNDPPDEDFIIRFYEDDGNGRPGFEVAGSPGPWVPDKREPAGPGLRTWFYSGDIQPPVQVEAGECYWMEFSGLGDECEVLITSSNDGNNYRLRGAIEEDGTHVGGGWADARVETGDLVFCVSSGMSPGPEPGVDGGCGDFPVSCCTAGGLCNDTRTLSTCLSIGGIPYPYMACSEVEGGLGCESLVPPNDLCENATEVCSGQTADPNLGVCTGYDAQQWEFGHVCEIGSDECDVMNADCEPWDGDVYRCTVGVDNRLAGTDGPSMTGTNCFGSGENCLQADVWYEVTAPCNGDMRITGCNSTDTFDAIVEVWGNHTPDPTCYQGELECNDDGCGGMSSTVSSLWLPGGEVGDGVTVGSVYQIRVGGWSNAGNINDASMGTFEMDVAFTCVAAPDVLPLELPDPLLHQIHRERKHRYLSIDPSTNGNTEGAIKVELTELLRCENDLRRSCRTNADCYGVCDNDSDITCVTDAQCPGSFCINGGDATACVQHPSVGMVKWLENPRQEPSGCRLDGGCTDTDWFAFIGAEPDGSPDEGVGQVRAWNNYGDVDSNVLHITDCEIIPVATYEVSFCLPPTFEECSTPLEIGTILLAPPTNYGDVVGAVDPVSVEFDPPNGIGSVGDISGYLLTNQNYGLPADPKPQAHWTWVDLEGEGAPLYRPQAILSVGDLSQILFGLVGRPYSWAGKNVDPDDCPPG